VRLIFKREKPKLFEIANFLMSTQSADAERVCKAHKFAHESPEPPEQQDCHQLILLRQSSAHQSKKIQDEKDQIALVLIRWAEKTLFEASKI
jgi:hypothetical protein